jgi:hypothetical protein
MPSRKELANAIRSLSMDAVQKVAMSVMPNPTPEQQAPSAPLRDPKQFARVAALLWNQWQPSPGMGGRLGLEYAVNV